MLESFLQHVWEVSIVGVIILFAAYYFFCARKILDINKQIKNVDAVKESESLKPLWTAFEKTLTDKKYSTIDAAEIFNTQNLTRGMNMTFWQNFGGIFTGLGILGTFAGLTFGLSGLDVTRGDIDVLKDGIKNLLSGVESAFVTSLVGIGASIVYSFIHHALIKNFQEKIQSLADKLDEKFPRRSAEDWLAQNYSETQEQTAALKNIGADIGSQKTILQNIGEDVASVILDGLDEKLENFSDKICAAIDNLGAGGAEKIGEIFTKGVGAQMERFSAALDRFSDGIDDKLKTPKIFLES